MNGPVRITPVDIANKDFPLVYRGYRRADVDEFLEIISADLEAITLENRQLQESLAAAHAELQRYRNMDAALRDTLVVAQRTADELVSNAKAQAETIRQQAMDDARRLLEQEQQKIHDLSALRERLGLELTATLRSMLQWVEQRMPGAAPPAGAPDHPAESPTDASAPRNAEAESGTEPCG